MSEVDAVLYVPAVCECWGGAGECRAVSYEGVRSGDVFRLTVARHATASEELSKICIHGGWGREWGGWRGGAQVTGIEVHPHVQSSAKLEQIGGVLYQTC